LFSLKKYIKENKIIFKNLIALSAIQGTNFLLPLITLPYVVITIGEVHFGFVSFAQSIFSYFLYLVDYGFNITATRTISVSKGNRGVINRVVGEVLVLKIFLLLLSVLLLILLVVFAPKLREHDSLYYWGIALLFGQAMLPTWFYQGVEKIEFLTYTNVVGKVIFTILIFIIIKEKQDYIYILPLYALGNIFSGFLSLCFMFKKFNISFHFPNSSALLSQLKDNFYVFVSNFSINIYMNSNIIILGFVTNNDIVVGYYSVADRFINAIKQILVVFFQATYPTACKIAIEGHKQLLNFFRNLAYPFSLFIFFISMLIYFYTNEIVILLTQSSIQEISNLMKILSISLFIVSLNIPAYQTLLAYNYQKSYLFVFVIGSLLNIVLNFILAHYLAMYGTAVSVLITELFITVGLYLALRVFHYSSRIV
jgi:PST family polysaccharide transporter